MGLEHPLDLIQLSGSSALKNRSSLDHLIRYSEKKLKPFKKSSQSLLSKISFSSDIHKAIQNSEFQLYYQPQIDFESGSLFGAEALIRWHHPERGIIYPNDFIPQAERDGLIVEIGKWGMNELFRQQKEWMDRGGTLVNVAVNLASDHFVRDDLLTDCEQLIQGYGISPDKISIELTERSQLSPEMWQQQGERLNQLGLQLSIDDFGTGYNTLVHLASLPIQFVKVDQSFTRQLTSSERHVNIVESILNLSKKLGYQAVIEGVETEEELSIIRTFGPGIIQGFYYDQALPAEDFWRKYMLLNRKESSVR